MADHEETPYALSFLEQAEQQLKAPSTSLLRLAAAARQAAARADDADDDLRVVVFGHIEESCRSLVDAAVVQPVLGRRGWTDRERQASEALQQQAARWGLTEDANDVRPTPPTVPAYLSQQAAERAAARARCAAGIRCTEPTCLAYGAVKVTHLVDSWLCAECIEATNIRLKAAGHAPTPSVPSP